jgi:amidophosphoribosyltransferase
MCGIVGIVGRPCAARDIYTGLLTMQHRGQDASGIVTYDQRFNIKKGLGLVQHVFTDEDLMFTTGSAGLGHVRYPTVGRGSAEDAQPFYVNVPFGIAMVHNGNVTNYLDVKRTLSEKSYRHLNSSCDVEAILNVLADELGSQRIKDLYPDVVFDAVQGVFTKVEGSYSVVALVADRGLLAFRDLHGIKPLVFGRRNGAHCFASESVVLDALGFSMERDVLPGEAIYIDTAGHCASWQHPEPDHYPCIFEWVYFARPDSVIDGISVYEARLRLGEQLAFQIQERGLKPDVVIPVPDTARAAALKAAETLCVPFREGLIKNRYIGRTFIMPGQSIRQRSVRQKLNPIRSEIEGKHVMLVDDSIVRGNTSREIISMVRQAGAHQVTFCAYSPPLRYPCVYGIDMSVRGEFIACEKSLEQVQDLLGADTLVYQTMEGLIRGVAGNLYGSMNFCTGCFNAQYPTHLSLETIHRIEAERLRSQM